MMKQLILFCLAAVLVYTTGCQKKETVRTSVPRPEKSIRSPTEKIVRLYRDTVYILTGDIIRNSGELLIIEDGTLIKANPGTASIIINSGGAIEANGTLENPIIFTSSEPLGTQDRNWGGISITGKSVNNATNPHGDATDLSGSLHYVRIEFAGLTLNSIGDRTIIENVQVSYADRSAFVVKGGTFNARNLVAYSTNGAADFYITEGFSGKMQFVLAYRHPFFGKKGSDPFNALAGIFIENNTWNPVDARPYTYPTISNATVIGPDAQNGTLAGYYDTLLQTAALVTTNSTGLRIRNSVFMGYPLAGWQLGDSLTASGIHFGLSELTYSVFHSNKRSQTFYLKPGVYPPFGNSDFENYMLQPIFNNAVFARSDNFLLADPFNYDHPNPSPKQSSVLNEGANFEGAGFSDPFFLKVDFRGALGEQNWLNGWTNFIPIKTDYNNPR